MCPLGLIISDNTSTFSDTRKEAYIRYSLEFERRIMENKTEETLQQKGITDKEAHVYDWKLMALLLDHSAKGNRGILSFQRWN